jgi:hypothetical protein
LALACIDNDVLIKCSGYRLLDELAAAVGGHDQIGVLGAARYVVRDRLARRPGIAQHARACADWEAFIEMVDELEPSDLELEFATAIEEAATVAGVQFDAGESQLCAITISRAVAWLATGDKRAIDALERLLDSFQRLEAVTGRVVCFEQLVQAISARLGDLALRALVCAEPDLDLAMSICYECTRHEHVEDFVAAGLESYVRHLRSVAPRVLAESAALD